MHCAASKVQRVMLAYIQRLEVITRVRKDIILLRSYGNIRKEHVDNWGVK